jgi:XTP/dITP diphosphohydrolase
MEIIVATRNRGKLAEIREALSDLGITLYSLEDFPDGPEVLEDGETFYENAVKKARETAWHTGKFALADDSGLVVDALGGEPGVYSARYAGEEADDRMNNDKLLAELKDVPEDNRTARFICVIAVAFPDGELITAHGASEGRIMDAPRGEQGFGYDPLFYSVEAGAGFSEISRKEKLKVSHRGRALQELKEKLRKWMNTSGTEAQ